MATVKRICPCCSEQMTPGHSMFTVLKKEAAYAVRGVPCFECRRCGYTAYTQQTTKKLEKLTSGRVLPYRPALRAWVYEWEDPIELADRDFTFIENKTYARAGTRADNLVGVA